MIFFEKTGLPQKLRLVEIFLIQAVIYLLLWLWNDYIASLISILMIVIFSGLLIVAIISEWIERSKVPKSYFIFMIGSILIPLIVGWLFLMLMGGELEWLAAMPALAARKTSGVVCGFLPCGKAAGQRSG